MAGLLLLWGTTIWGILYKSISTHKFQIKLNCLLSYGMGWYYILPVIIIRTSWLFILFIVLGGLSYTIGAWFYAQNRPYFHMIWHIFIVIASLFHFIGIVYFM